MKLDTVESFYTGSLAHALSLLLANRPHLLTKIGIYSELLDDLSGRDKSLLDLANYLSGHTTAVDFFFTFRDIDSSDIECWIMAFEVMLSAKLMLDKRKGSGKSMSELVNLRLR